MSVPNNCNPFSLQGEFASITGGGTGLGLAIASAMVQAGARVALAGRRRDILDQAVESLGPKAIAAAFDITKPDACEEYVTRLTTTRSPITILVNNAGIHLKKAVQDTSVTEFHSVWQTHVQGAFVLSRAVIPSMQRQGRGSILFISSMTAFIGMPHVVAYSAAKSAYTGMVRSMASDWRPTRFE